MSEKLNAITSDIIAAYTNLTNRNADWVEQLSLGDFIELRKQAVFELEKNISPTKENSSKSKRKPKSTETIVEKPKVLDIEKPTKTNVKEVVEKPTKKVSETIKEPPKPKVEEPLKQTIVEPPKIENSKPEPKVETQQTSQNVPYDKKHDQEELDLFNRLKD